ncbi:ribonuclease P protein component [Candidatus Neoehrlichia procyonis]|uniref:Ribonuclease P protein component n=1 Tax=Candidatus Neoehrlichia procyonis str. RAC413 TaxID=1359163 RepID=A0A0F3NQ45_9RICK|nr:ribonuclease P protein component [Candidatus Neoehrlichia lotoris]KJV69034.1 ribonuclease P protein component [Candidatus Neoehrlichia lotoris str. RAC413]
MRLKGLVTLKKRKEFLFARSQGISAGKFGLFLQAAQEFYSLSCNSNIIRVGFTVSKKVGNAVVRNKIKRRFRALAQDILVKHGNKNFYYILIGGSYVSQVDFKKLHTGLIFCLKKLNLYNQ